MTRFGYTLMTEQSGPKELVDATPSRPRRSASTSRSRATTTPRGSTEQGHAPYAWTVLGAVAHATERVELMTYVTCPTMRYHPAVVAQKAATLQILADGRFTLGLGSGENLNEHVVGEGWPTVADAPGHAREAVEIIRELFTGELVDLRGRVLPGRLRPHLGPARRARRRSASPSPATQSHRARSPRWPTT